MDGKCSIKRDILKTEKQEKLLSRVRFCILSEVPRLARKSLVWPEMWKL